MNSRNYLFRLRATIVLYFVVVLVFGLSLTGSAESCFLDVTEIPVVEYCPASSSNFSQEYRSDKEIQYIVIHTVQGSLDSAVHTFSSSKLNYPRSAHYTIGFSGEVVKSVPVRKTAWHAGTSPIGSGEKYESRVLNANSIGIEHEGHVDGSKFPTKEQYYTSAALTRYLCELYDIPMNRNHIVGHGEIKSAKGDPGPNWDWKYYMNLVRNGARRIPGGPGSESTQEIAGGKRLLSSSMVAMGVALTVYGFLNTNY